MPTTTAPKAPSPRAIPRLSFFPRNSNFMLLPTLLMLMATLFSSVPYEVEGVDRSNFKTCEQAAFCKRHRRMESNPKYNVIADSLQATNESSITGRLQLQLSQQQLEFTLAWLEDDTLRLYITAVDEARPRFHPSVVIPYPPVQHKAFTGLEKGVDNASFTTYKERAGGYKIVVNYRPFRVDVFKTAAAKSSSKESTEAGAGSGDKLLVCLNAKNLLKFELFRQKVEGEQNDEGFWEESFKSIQDSKPFGSSSVGMDITFVGSTYIYGLPEHADTLPLKNTDYTDPYRLYNLDVFEFELNNPMALYGSIPFVAAHSKERTTGALWLNAAETWVDIHSSTADKGVLASLIEKLSPASAATTPQMDVHFISESGVIDLYLYLGPNPRDVWRQNAKITGTAPLPALSAIAYHQCRWNYNDESDLLGVHAAFDEHDIPVDVLWLDIEHTDGKRYFTWDPVKFPHPAEMIRQLERKGRQLVTVVDPHIKRDDNYRVFSEATSAGYFVKKADGETDYEGHCWPGASSWIDFVNPAARDFWAEQYQPANYPGANEMLWTWNDMNEPSVFTGPETTMHKDARHHGGWEHRDLHNLYGQLVHASTYAGHMKRSQEQVRPFVLTRAFFAGSQRTAATWAGDNTASWEHLRSTVPMLLSISMAGLPLVGADIGGFFGNPDGQLLTRWYQAAAFQPFFREHAHIDTRRREPWLFDSQYLDAIRKAIRMRYSFLPYWYTTFYEHTLNGGLVMAPVFSEFPADEPTFYDEREWMVGRALLVHPVMEPDVTSTSLYLPGKGGAWYEWESHRMHLSPGAVYIDTPIDKIPHYQRGGTIIPVRERARRSSKLMRADPISLYIGAELDREYANGTLYMDDGESFAYKSDGEENFFYWGYTYKKSSDQLYTITSRQLDKRGKWDPAVWIERIVIRGVRYYPATVHLYADDYTPIDLEFTHDRDLRLIVIRKPGAYVAREWRIDIHC